MTEKEWFATQDPDTLIDATHRLSSLNCVPTKNRKLSFFSIACCREVLSISTDEEPIRIIVNAAERILLGWGERRELPDLIQWAIECRDKHNYAQFWYFLGDAVVEMLNSLKNKIEFGFVGRQAARAAARAVARWCDGVDSHLAWTSARRSQADILRSMFGPPYRKISIPNNHDITAIALSVYQDRTESGQLQRDLLLILSDALEDAGADGCVLTHLRDGQTHYMGDWVIDNLLNGVEVRNKPVRSG